MLANPLAQLPGHPGTEPTPAEAGPDLLGVEAEEAPLLRTDLTHIDLIVAGVQVALDRRQMTLNVGAADNPLSHLLLGDQGADLL